MKPVPPLRCRVSMKTGFASDDPLGSSPDTEDLIFQDCWFYLGVGPSTASEKLVPSHEPSRVPCQVPQDSKRLGRQYDAFVAPSFACRQRHWFTTSSRNGGNSIIHLYPLSAEAIYCPLLARLCRTPL